MTKYDQEIQRQGERVLRKHNIEQLQARLDDARHLLASIPDDGYNTVREKRVVRAEIRKLTEFLIDEERAYKATFEDEGKAGDIILKMGL
ncbi:MAG: hypothetical protein IK092_07390 [Muribaculaceae bacterium]|nr:hypothetical protein [Muribaculaceae bacterium]